MSGLNQVTLVGRLGQTPEIKDINGVKITNFSLATSKSWKDDSGEKQTKTEWHRITCFRKTAELAAQYLTKGSQALIVGELQTRSWEKDGVKRYQTEIIAQNIQFLDSKPKTETAKPEDTGPEPLFDSSENTPF